jgi:hypothetical protein
LLLRRPALPLSGRDEPAVCGGSFSKAALLPCAEQGMRHRLVSLP